jgi:exopolysaccharide biosynthesis polyprenyl glycosylphosphotransferase
MVVVVMASFWTKFEFSRTWVGITWIFVILLELITHRVWREYIHKRKLDGRLTLRTLVVGTNPDAVQLIGSLQKPASGFEVVGIVETQDFDIPFDDVPLVGRIDDLLKSIYRYGIDCLFMAGPRLEEQDMLKVTQTARQQNAEIRVAANLPEIIGPRLNVQPMGGIMTLSLKPVQLSGVEAVVKRVFDLVVGGFVLLLSLPVLLVVALAIKLGSKGPVFFTQARVTKGGHPFKMFKFRTMSEDADRILEEESVDSTAPFFKLGEDDPRVTPVGGFLRRFSLDELPQLINVIKGEMSLVGPRPLPADQVAANLDLLGPRHEVPAGVTGWWQIQGRSDVGPEEAVRMDLFYIENWSLALDLYVLLKTVGVVMAKKGAY